MHSSDEAGFLTLVLWSCLSYHKITAVWFDAEVHVGVLVQRGTVSSVSSLVLACRKRSHAQPRAILKP
jgi:hypothetical protein